MRNVKWLVAAVLVASTTGCVESVNQGYGYNGGYGYSNAYPSGYSNAYYPSSGSYYSRPAPVNNYYYNPQPTVVTQTRYVPVPTPVPVRQPDRWNDHRWGGRDNDKDYRRQAPRTDRPNNPPPQANNNNGPRPGPGGGYRHDGGNNRDRDGDGKPDRRG
ncbi:hypothetical protein [Reyranella sp.]|uniref:hypothetical protein n=1 Tax=Reyranella sp. TaxID=1929291 RepID=UPI003D0B4455